MLRVRVKPFNQSGESARKLVPLSGRDVDRLIECATADVLSGSVFGQRFGFPVSVTESETNAQVPAQLLKIGLLNGLYIRAGAACRLTLLVNFLSRLFQERPWKRGQSPSLARFQ
jgi:hypothetical protein